MIRRAIPADAPAIHALGLTIPELKVSASGEFMTLEELTDTLAHQNTVAFVALTRSHVQGFVLANIADVDHAPSIHHACIVYLAVAEPDRRNGLAEILYEMCKAEFKARGVKYVYCWADTDSGVVRFMEKRGFAKGKTCVWMDREI